MNRWLDKANKIVYDCDSRLRGKPLSPEEFSEEFNIPCWPYDRKGFGSHIPDSWADEIRIFLKDFEEQVGDFFVIDQIKEKYCSLVIYTRTVYDYSMEEDEDINILWNEKSDIIEKLKKGVVDKLKAKGVYPTDA